MERARRPRLLPALSARGLLLRGLPASCSPPSLLSGLLASLLTSLPASFPPAWPPSALGLAGRAPSPKRVALAKSVEQPQRRQLRCFCVSKVKVSRCLLPLAGFKKKTHYIYTATDWFERKHSYSSQITLLNSCTCFQHRRHFSLVFQSLLRIQKACRRASSGLWSMSWDRGPSMIPVSYGGGQLCVKSLVIGTLGHLGMSFRVCQCIHLNSSSKGICLKWNSKLPCVFCKSLESLLSSLSSLHGVQLLHAILLAQSVFSLGAAASTGFFFLEGLGPHAFNHVLGCCAIPNGCLWCWVGAELLGWLGQGLAFSLPSSGSALQAWLMVSMLNILQKYSGRQTSGFLSLPIYKNKNISVSLLF